MKRRGMLALLSSTVAVSFMATVISTLAWFNTTINVSPEDKLSGFSDGAYFAGGDGLTAETAFIIRTPRHLYNLAWLQYLGYFNEDKKNNTTGAASPDGIIDQQYYFILDNDLDMNPGDTSTTQWTLPPIGTQKFPFVGTFIGNNKTITDLRISNFFSDYNKTPSSIKSSSDIKDLNIVGFFGVVGTLSSDENSSSIKSGTVTYTYDKSANSVSNLGLDNLEVKSTTGNILIGLAAGYVNGSVSGVAVKDSKITTNGNSRLTGFGTSTNLSDYSLAGFVRPAYLSVEGAHQKDVTAETPEVDNQTISGAGDEFGASIAMKTIYTRLVDNFNDSTPYTYHTTEYTVDGEVFNSTSANYYHTYNSTKYNYSYYSETDDEDNTIAQYSFWDGGNTDYMYLHGNEEVDYSTNVYSYSSTASITSGSTFYISDASGKYFSISNDRISVDTNISNAVLFTYTNKNYISFTYNSSTYYLYNNSGSLSGSSNNYSKWTIDSNGRISSTYNNQTYYLYCTGSGWAIKTYNATTKNVITDNKGNYLKYNNSYTPANATSLSDATNWIWSGTYYYPEGNTNKQLSYGGSSYLLDIYQNGGNYYTFEGDYLTTTVDGTKYYVTVNTGSDPVWWASSNEEYKTKVYYQTITESLDDYNLKLVGSTGSTRENRKLDVLPTYMPLSYTPIKDAEDKITGYEDSVYEKNTGYMISGPNYQIGDIRVSKYGISSLSNAMDGSTYDSSKTNVVTINSSTGNYALIEDSYNKNNSSINSDLTSQFGNTRTDIKNLGLQKYTASRNQLHDLLNNASNVYGLHFMNAEISPSQTVEVPYASINGISYDNYELPLDCIDFNLKNNGIVNFFAGSYFSGNTTFFSLHHIERNSSTQKISAINEISKIYKNVGKNRKQCKYIYEYNTDPVTYNCDLGSGENQGVIETENNVPVVLFDMDWVTSPTMVTNALYYYEIPVNKGEYALGSVSGKTGAYLIYLDIGAGMKTRNVTTYTEKITTATKTYTFVKGIDFVATIPTNLAGFTALTGDLVANVALPSAVNGSTTYGYNASTKILTCGPPSGVTMTASYIRYGVTVNAGLDNPLVATYVNSSTVVLDKKTEITYDTDAETVTKVVSYSTDGGNTWESDDPITIATEVQDYNASATISSAGLDIVHFHYQVPSNATVSLNTEYNSDTDTYEITLTSSAATTIYIDSVLASATVDAIEVNYTVKINGITVSTGCNPIPVSAS